MPKKRIEQLSPHPPLVITNCTTRKRAVGTPVRLTNSVPRESLPELVKRWARLVASAPADTPVGELYVGRAMVEAKLVCSEIGAELCVVSAGLGLVHERQMVPNYDVSASSAEGVLASTLRSSGKEVAEWWVHLTRAMSRRTIHEVVEADCGRLVFLALPASYLRLVVKDLEGIQPRRVSNLRILTSVAGALEVPSHLQDCVLPYTEQLESLDGYDGTRAEFPQRALRHFVVAIGGSRLPLGRAHAAVRQSLSHLQFRHIPPRERKTDEEIASLIREGWDACGGSSTELLRYLRNDRLVACEQGRFRTIWRQVGAELIVGKR